MSPASPRAQVPIELGDRSYAILIGSGLLDSSESWSDAPASAQALIVTNTTVAPLYADRLRRAIAPRHSQVHVVALPDGEEFKGWETLNVIFDALLAKACDRKTVLYALG